MTQIEHTDPVVEQQFQNIQELFKNSTYVFDKVPRTINETLDFIKQEYPKHTIEGWNKAYRQFLKELSEKNMGYTSLPEEEQKDFYTSVKINAFVEYISEKMYEDLENQSNKVGTFKKIYREYQAPDFLAAKKALHDNLEALIEKEKNQHHIDFKKTFYSIKELKDYFKTFIFDMQNHHSGKHELVKSKNLSFPTSTDLKFDNDAASSIFRFFDCISEAFKKVRYNEKQEIINKDEIVDEIFTAKIHHGCGYCNSNNFITFNHEERLLQEIEAKECPTYSKKHDTDYLKTKITTTGKLIFINDVRQLTDIIDIDDEITNMGQEHDVSTYINVWGGQNGFMNIYAQLFNVAYFQAGNHGAHLKRTKNGLEVTYYNDQKDSLGSLSLSLWAVSLIDYESAIKLAGSEEALKKALSITDHTIVDVKPGTYEVINILKNTEDVASKSKKDIAFGKIVWKNDDTILKPFTKAQWKKLQ